MERAMSVWTLEFHDPILESSFRTHYWSWVIPKIRVGVQIQMALHLLFGSLELIFGYTAGAVMGVLCLRLAILVSLTAFSSMTLDNKFHKVMDPLTLGVYMLNSSLLVAIDIVGSARGTELTANGYPFYFFFEGRWSLPSSLLFVVVVYHTSGLRYMFSNIVAWTHYLFLWLAMVSGFCCKDGFGSFFTQSSALVPILLVLSMISSNIVERQTRGDFVLRCYISSEKGRADAICASMLPARVSELLKEGTPAKDVLQEWPEVTILFCYITGFKELTTSCDTYDVVDFVNSLFSIFDKCTEYHHVYKLEAIDSSYLCCAGGGQEGEIENLAPHADRIWDMAVTMLAVATHGSRLPTAVGATASRGGAVLKIGVHTGRVVGGVSGVKSYSYHLFGDTVNMASRTASTGVPGRVQLSTSTFKCLSPEKQSSCELRKGVPMKGKGLIDTHLVIFDPDVLGQRLWRNFLRFEKMTKIYDPNFQQKGEGRGRHASAVSQEGKLHMIRVKRLKFTLKGSNYEDAQNTALGDELEKEYQHQYNASRLRHFQYFLIVAWLCVSCSIFLDFFYLNSSLDGNLTKLAMRVSFCVLLLVVLLCSRDPKFIGWLQAAGAFTAVAFSLVLNALVILVPVYHMMDMNIICLVTISLLMDLQYTYALAVNAFTVVVYTVVVVVSSTHQGHNVVGYLLFVYGAALIGTYACGKREREFRYTYLHRRILEDNKVKAEALLKNMFPNVRHVRALVKGRRVVDHLDDVTIMFSDLKGYTQWASDESPKEVYRVLNKVYTAFDTHLDALGVYKVDTIGDAFVVVAGLDGFKSKEDHAMAMMKYAFRTLFELERIKAEEDLKFEMRVGLHSGSCIGGVIGTLKPRYLCWGRTPFISNELEAAGTPGKLLVSSTTFAKLNKQVLLTRGLKFRPGEPLHVKTFDGTADEEVLTFFIEMDTITAFTILANEIAEDRATAKKTAVSAMGDDGGLGGTTDDWNPRKTLVAVTHLKRLFKAKSGGDGCSRSYNYSECVEAGRPNIARQPNHLSPSGVVMTTQSAYLASPPGSPVSKQDTETSGTTTLRIGGNGTNLARTPGSTATATKATGAESKTRQASARVSPPLRLRRASSAGGNGRNDRQRRRSSAMIIPAMGRGSATVVVPTEESDEDRGRGRGSFSSHVGIGRQLDGSDIHVDKNWGRDGEVSHGDRSIGGGDETGRAAGAKAAEYAVEEPSGKRRSTARRRSISGRKHSTTRSDVSGDGGLLWDDAGDGLEGRAPSEASVSIEPPSSPRKKRRRRSGASSSNSGEDEDGRGGDSGSSGEDATAPTRGRRRGRGTGGGRQSLYIEDDEGRGGGSGGHGSKFLDDDDDDDDKGGRRSSGGETHSTFCSQEAEADDAIAARVHEMSSGSDLKSDTDSMRGGSMSEDSDSRSGGGGGGGGGRADPPRWGDD